MLRLNRELKVNLGLCGDSQGLAAKARSVFNAPTFNRLKLGLTNPVLLKLKVTYNIMLIILLLGNT